MLPRVGPALMTIPGISGISVAGASSGSEVRYRWPAQYRLGALYFALRSGSQVELGNTSLRLVDETQQELAADGFGTAVSVPGLALRGIGQLNTVSPIGGRWQAFQRIVEAGDIWVFQVLNDNAGPIVPDLLFRLEDP